MIERLSELMRGGSSKQQLGVWIGAVLVLLLIDWQYVSPDAITLRAVSRGVRNGMRAKTNAREEFERLPAGASVNEASAAARRARDRRSARAWRAARGPSV
jgi:hypothetical protein